MPPLRGQVKSDHFELTVAVTAPPESLNEVSVRVNIGRTPGLCVIHIWTGVVLNALVAKWENAEGMHHRPTFDRHTTPVVGTMGTKSRAVSPSGKKYLMKFNGDWKNLFVVTDFKSIIVSLVQILTKSMQL